MALAAALIGQLGFARFGTAQSPLNGSLGIHDPSTIVKEGTRYYLYGTGDGVRMKFSDDRLRWQSGPAVFADPPTWIKQAVPEFSGESLWAPEIAYFNNAYHLYYSASTFGKQVSVIGLATNATLDPASPDYKWVDQGPVIQSTTGSPYNTIDPSIFQAANGNVWMTFGSFWNGIYSVQLDPLTGKRIAANSPTTRLAYNSSIEASYLYEHDGDYYLFVNWGQCCNGVSSTYNIRVGRSDSPTGPFTARNGAALTASGGTLLLATQGRYIGPGHAGIFADDGQEWFGYHYYDGLANGSATYDLRPLSWTADGWPVLGSFPAGDYDGDLDTDGDDFLAWQRTLGRANGAADGDDNGTVNAADLAVWRAQMAAQAGNGAWVIPEPALSSFAAVWAIWLAGKRRHSHRRGPRRVGSRRKNWS